MASPSRSFHPPQRSLFGPGPSDVDPRVLAAMARPTVGHLDPSFILMMDDLKSLLRSAFRTENPMTLPLSAPGSAGMEACFANLIEPGDRAIVCVNGVFGMRMVENVERAGGVATIVEDEWGRAVDPGKLEAALAQNPDTKVVAFVHAETSTGALSDAETLCRVARQKECLTIVDAVTSLAGSPLEVDAWGIDAVYSGSQKCLSCTPGLSPVSFGARALEATRKRQTKPHSWFLDLNLLAGYWDEGAKRAYHHTAPINPLYGLHEALVLLDEEGVENSWARHARNHLGLRAGLEAMGLSFVVPEAERLPQLNAVSIPDGVDDAAVRRILLDEHGIEIGAGLGALAGKVWRIGLMGSSSRADKVLRLVSSLDAVLAGLGAKIPRGAAVDAARAALA
ncbi:MAG: alanine--glyoxylate aminotransferase family protein [Candidatus Binatia bacterium]|nr:alanine--glyoxylate aminotransferase family protein [Candidatus Binatia bacterium]